MREAYESRPVNVLLPDGGVIAGEFLIWEEAPGKRARNDDIVSIFDSGPDVAPVSLGEQEQFYHRWLESLNE